MVTVEWSSSKSTYLLAGYFLVKLLTIFPAMNFFFCLSHITLSCEHHVQWTMGITHHRAWTIGCKHTVLIWQAIFLNLSLVTKSPFSWQTKGIKDPPQDVNMLFLTCHYLSFIQRWPLMWGAWQPSLAIPTLSICPYSSMSPYTFLHHSIHHYLTLLIPMPLYSSLGSNPTTLRQKKKMKMSP